jgi:antitoxin VapB
MGILIKNAATEAKIRKLAEKTGESLTTAVERAVDERLERIPEPAGRVDRKRLADILAYFDSLPVDDARAPNEIIGYDHEGVPK